MMTSDDAQWNASSAKPYSGVQPENLQYKTSERTVTLSDYFTVFCSFRTFGQTGICPTKYLYNKTKEQKERKKERKKEREEEDSDTHIVF